MTAPSEALRDAARARLASIVEKHLALPLAEDRFACSLMTGDPGRALFLAYVGEATGNAQASEQAATILVHAAERIEIVSDLPTFHAGFTGCAWALEHLARLIDLPPDANDEIDSALRDIVNMRPAWLEQEWLTGAAGFTVYASERRHQGLLYALLKYFEANEATANTKIGVAHGAAGVISALCAIAAVGVEPVRALALADRIAARLVERPAGTGRSRFPVLPHLPDTWWTWCNGDLGVAGALAHRERALASEIALRIAAALDDGETPPIGGSLCHGWAGVAYVMTKLAARFPDERIARGARRAFELALADTTGDDDSLLTGTAGVGLVLLAATTDREPAWERALFLSGTDV